MKNRRKQKIISIWPATFLIVSATIPSLAPASCLDRLSDIPASREMSDFNLEYGHLDSMGEAKVFLSSDGIFDKPIIVVEGLDLSNTQDCFFYSGKINDTTTPLLSDWITEGRDVVIIDFQDATISIQENAKYVQKIILEANYRKSGNHYSAVVGLSMGGLVARYALVDMEYNNIEHQTSLFVSYDSPQKFANVLPGLQSTLGLGGIFYDSPEMREAFYNFFEPMAVKQMLGARYFFGFNENLKPYWNKKNYNRGLMNDLKQKGNYPTKLRKVAFSNGGYEVYGFEDGERVAYIDFPPEMEQEVPILSLLTSNDGVIGGIPIWAHDEGWFYAASADCDAKTSNPFGTTFYNVSELISKVWTCAFASINGSWIKEAAITPGGNPYSLDRAPGSYFPNGGIFELVKALPGMPFDVIVDHQYSSFIPTISALDIDTNDILFNVGTDSNLLDKTPFDEVYYPSNGMNEEHLALTNEKYIELKNVMRNYHVGDSADSDSDGIINRIEYSIGTDPFKSDSDKDGMSDGYEYDNGLNPVGYAEDEIYVDRNGDKDSDGFTNYHEYCGSVTNSDTDCVPGYRSQASNPNSTPITQRAAVLVAINQLLL